MDNDEMGDLIRQWGKPADFHPFAYYHRDLDFIYIMVRDCSVTEVRINEILDILEANHPEEGRPKYVGFMINSARRFCLKYGLGFEGEVDLVKLVDKVMKIYPCPIGFQDEIYRIFLQAPHVIDLSYPTSIN